MSVSEVISACANIDRYYTNNNIANKVIRNYWYGGEPTDMGLDYFYSACDGINSVFTPEKGYDSTHTILSSLVTIKDEAWFDVLRKYSDSYIQTSFDGFMRGKGYLRNWEKKVRWMQENDISVGTISVVNEELVREGAVKVLDYLSELGITETSWLPFMLNLRNSDTGMYDRYAPTMKVYSDFMIDLTNHYIKRKEAGLHVPEIGQMHFIIEQSKTPAINNIASQTMFLMPDGTMALPDYLDSTYKEFLKPFGNILTQELDEILTSEARRSYVRKQIVKNGNKECMGCEHSDKCVMEFWKDNREGDDCFGGKGYIEWLLNNKDKILSDNVTLY